MEHPRPKPGARERFDRLDNNSTYQSIPAPRQNQARPLDDDHPGVRLVAPPHPWRALGPVVYAVVNDLRQRLGTSS